MHDAFQPYAFQKEPSIHGDVKPCAALDVVFAKAFLRGYCQTFLFPNTKICKDIS